MGFGMVEMRFHGFRFHPMANGKVQNKSFLESPSFEVSNAELCWFLPTCSTKSSPAGCFRDRFVVGLFEFMAVEEWFDQKR